MRDRIIRYLKNDWPLWVVLGLVILNLFLVCWLLFHPAPEKKEEPSGTIQQLYQVTDGLNEMQSVMEVLTLHGSIQYFADEENWLYFEQMAGGFRITLGRNAEEVDYWEREVDGVAYHCIEETLGSELAWENSEGYMFYLYSSLDIDALIYISQHMELRPEGQEYS